MAEENPAIYSQRAPLASETEGPQIPTRNHGIREGTETETIQK